jgi:hypothetical protein
MRKNYFSKELVSILSLTVLGGYLRFHNLGERPLFCDETYVALWVRGSISFQELIPVLIIKLFDPQTEFGLRFLYALAGTLTISAIWYVLKEGKFLAALIVTIFPLFVFWSKLARPYSIAGLFIVLGWRWWQFYIPALFATPISLVGVKLIKQKKHVLIGSIIFAAIFYFLRQDVGERQVNFTTYIWQSSRFLYLPSLVILLYFFDYLYKYLNKIFMVIAVIFLSFYFVIDDIDISNEIDKIDNQWYRREVSFADWRNVGQVDYSTQPNISEYYSKKSTKILGKSDLLNWQKDSISLSNQLMRGDTVTMGIDRRGNWKGCKEYLIKIVPDLFEGENYSRFISYTYYDKQVLRLKVYKNKWWTY